MSDDPDRLTPADEQDLKAAEFVLGLLGAAEARAVEALALHDQAMSASIEVWQTRLAPLAELVEPHSPPSVLWQRLALATGLESVIRTRMASRTAAGRAAPWQMATAASLILAAALGGLLLGLPGAPAEPLVAALSPYNAPGASFLVQVGADGKATVVAVGNTAVPPGRSLQLWAVAGSAAPVSMGLLPTVGRAQLTIAAPSGTSLLVSQEPAGGSPQPGPTGPVLYQGTLTRL